MELNSFTSNFDPSARESWAASWKAFVGTALLLIPIAVFVNHRFSVLIEDSTPEHKTIRQLRIPMAYDAVILGSSRARFAIDPAAFGEKGRFYNLASAGASATMTRMRVEFFFDQRNRSHLALLEVYPLTFDPKQLWRRSYHEAAAMGYEETLRYHDLVYGTRRALDRALIRIHALSLWTERVPPERLLMGVPLAESWRIVRTRDDPRGFRMGFTPLWEREFSARPLIVRLESPKFQIDPVEVAAFEYVISKLQDEGTVVVLVETPTCLRKVVGDVYDRYRKEVGRIVAKYGLLHLNYREGNPSTSVADKQEYYWDSIHLSELGAVRFSEELWRHVRARIPRLE